MRAATQSAISGTPNRFWRGWKDRPYPGKVGVRDVKREGDRLEGHDAARRLDGNRRPGKAYRAHRNTSLNKWRAPREERLCPPHLRIRLTRAAAAPCAHTSRCRLLPAPGRLPLEYQGPLLRRMRPR